MGSNVAGSLTYITNLNIENLETGLKNADKKAKGLGGTLQVALGNLMANLTQMAVSGLKQIASASITYNAQIEKYQTALTTLTGSAEQANKIIEQIKTDAAKTPFDVQGLVQANQLLISAGINSDNAREDILALGNAISATGGGNEELARMAVNLQQIKNVGKASALDIKQFAYAGIDIYGLLADSMGITREEAAKLDVSYDMLSNALNNANKEGGKYYKAMEKQSKTYAGAMSNLKESFQALSGELSQGVFEAIKDLIPKLTEMFNWLSENKDIVLAVASAILIWLNAITAMLIITKITGLITAFSAVVGISAGAIGLWIIAIGAVVAAFILLYNKCEWFRNAVDTIWEFIKNVFQVAYQFIYSNVIEPFISKIMFLVEKMIWLKDKFININDGIQNAWNGIGTFFKNIFSAIKDSFKSVINWIIDKFNWFIRQVNKIKFPDWEWLGDLAGKGFNFKELNKLATGTNYVPQDMIAEIHEGEAVVPKKFNPYANGVNASMLGTMNKESNVIVNIEKNMEFDALGQLVNNVKTFSGGAKNDYNYGMGG